MITKTRAAMVASTDELIACLEQDTLPQDERLVELFRRARGGDVAAIEWFKVQITLIEDYLEKS